MRSIAGRHNERANRLQEDSDVDGAIAAYVRATHSDPNWSVPWYNLGLLYKRQRNWPESLRHNKRAVELDDSDEAAWWNLGIAATALGDWHEARAAWQGCGIDIPDGDGPLNMELGPVPIRLNAGGEEVEVVWSQRIDPARAIIENIPFPESGHRCGDLLLHDGAAEGTRMLRGVEVPVFNAIEILQPSELGTFIVNVRGFTALEARTVVDEAEKAGLEAEDWSKNIRYLCKACSEGSPAAEHHHDEVEDDQPGERMIGIAARSEAAVRDLLDRVVGSVEGGVIESVECALPPLPVQ